MKCGRFKHNYHLLNLYYGPVTILRVYIKDLISSSSNSVRMQHFDLQFRDKEIGQDYTIMRQTTPSSGCKVQALNYFTPLI